MVGANRIVMGSKIVNPLGNADLTPEDEIGLRKSILERALTALQADIEEQTVFN